MSLVGIFREVRQPLGVNLCKQSSNNPHQWDYWKLGCGQSTLRRCSLLVSTGARLIVFGGLSDRELVNELPVHWSGTIYQTLFAERPLKHLDAHVDVQRLSPRSEVRL